MDTQRIHKDITQLLYKIEEQYGRIIHFKDAVPMLEIDLALKDVRDLYECLLDLRTATELVRRQQAAGRVSPEVAPKVQVAETVPAPSPALAVAPAVTPSSAAQDESIKIQSEPKVVEAKVEELPEAKEQSPVTEAEASETEQMKQAEPQVTAETPAEQADESPQKSVEPARAAVVPPTAFPSENSKPPVTEPKKDLLQERQKDFVPTVRKIEFKPEPSGTEPQRKESLFDKAASLYDKIAKPAEKTVAAQAGRQPISNIKSSIGINEKFIYLKDLFKNNINEYNEALDKLNNFESYEEAEDYFQELKSKYQWDPDSKSFQGLADLLNRRYLHSASS